MPRTPPNRAPRSRRVSGSPGATHRHPSVSRRRPVPRRLASTLATLLALILLLAGCAGGPSDVPGAKASPVRGPVLNVYAFATAKPAYEALARAYAGTPEGADVTLLGSYGASGDQARKVQSGAPADVTGFSLTPDTTRLVTAGLVDPHWNAGPDHGTPFGSVVVMVVRKGNPKDIHTWQDLLRPGIDVVTPNPLSSGSAQWNLLAPYAAVSHGGRDPQAGLAYLRTLVHDHVTTRPSSSSDANETFRQGHGDVLLSYESEALTSQRLGQQVDYVVPDQTIRIEFPVAAVSASPNRAEAQKFVDFLSTPPAQQALAAAGYRPTDPGVATAHAATFPVPARLWTVADLGGWPTVTTTLFDQDTGAITTLYTEATR